MPKVSKFTKEQKLEIVLGLMTGKRPHAEVCRKCRISSTDAYKLRDWALDLLRQGIDHETLRTGNQGQYLIRRVANLDQEESSVGHASSLSPDRTS